MTAARLGSCVASVWATWTVHDWLQERVFRVPGFHFGIFMAFCLQAVSVVLALANQLAEGNSCKCLDATAEEKKRRDAEAARRREAVMDEEQETGLLTEAEEKDTEPPNTASAVSSPISWLTLSLYLLLSMLIAAANGAATAALNYVSMQTKVLFKSSKIITVMAVGAVLFRRFYRLDEYAYMLLVVCGLACFLLAGSAGALISSLPGVALLSLAVLSDSLVPNVQQTLLLTRPKHEMIFHTNWISALLTLCYMALTGEAASATRFLSRRPRVMGLMLLQALCGYLGILAYLETVKTFGSKVTTIVTSCRKLFTILLSTLSFHHPLTGFHVAGVLSVFLGVVLNANADLRCSKLVAPPALLMMGILVYVELNVRDEAPETSTAATEGFYTTAVLPWLRVFRSALKARIL